MKYLHQTDKGGSSCALVAIINAARFFNIKTTELGTKRWEELVDIALCRHGSALKEDAAAAEFGLVREPVNLDLQVISNNLPVSICVENPEERGSSMHAVLIVGVEGDLVEVVNYRWIYGPIVEKISWQDLPLYPPGHTGHRAHSFRQK